MGRLGVAFALAASSLAQAPKLGIARQGSLVRLEIAGQHGADIVVQSRAHLGETPEWETVLGLNLTNTSHSWLDSQSSAVPWQLYRAVQLDPAAAAAPASNFRLLDGSGRSRELDYELGTRSVVLIFADTSCPEYASCVPRLQALRTEFEPQGISFWTVDSDPSPSRSNLVARASALGVDWPVLHDRAGLVRREYGVKSTPEVVVVDRATWMIAYRGAIDDELAVSAGGVAPQAYLDSALRQMLAQTTIGINRTSATGCVAPASSTALPVPSYPKDIAPVLRANCVSCHSPGNIGPWSMTDYAAVKAHATVIKDVLLTQRMPPWHADPEYGAFSNDVALPPSVAANIARWVDAGAPRGDGPDPLATTSPPSKDYPGSWPVELGQPDYVLSIPNQSIPATGEVPYRYLEVKTALSSDVWLRAAVVKPGNTKVVHHCLVFLGNKLEVFFVNGGGLVGFFAGYVPGMRAVEYPAGTGKLLPQGQIITFQMHYTTTGTPETDQTEIGFYTMPAPPAMPLLTKSAFNLDLTIPPGEPNYEREAEFTPSATRDVMLYEFSPHMHLRGARFQYEALYPDGGSEVLLSVPRYEFHWQTLYRLATPKRLPAGTIIRCRGAFDNSAQNLDNPNPAQQVKFGDQTDDEMFIGYLNYAELP